jgi:hypothetical protein
MHSTWLRGDKPKTKDMRQVSTNDGTIAKPLKAVHYLQEDVKAIKQGTGKSTSFEQNCREIVCTYCKKKYHRFANKRKLEVKKSGREFSRDKKRKKANNNSNRIGVSRRVGEAGMSVNSVVNGTKVKLLIDTGATCMVSIISPDILHFVIGDPKPMLSEGK